MTVCASVNCDKTATCAAAIAFYDELGQLVTRLVIGIQLCDDCEATLKPSDVVSADQLSGFIQLVAKTHQRAIDVFATEIVRIELTDPAYRRVIDSRG